MDKKMWEKITNLLKEDDKFVDENGKIILRIIDGKLYEYLNGNYILSNTNPKKSLVTRDAENTFDYVYKFFSDNGFDKVFFSESWDKSSRN